MVQHVDTDREPIGTREKIMFGTSRALVKYGYAGITIQRIADETDLSKSTFYNHFEGKDDLLLSFASFILEDFERNFDEVSTGDPVEDLYRFLRVIISPSAETAHPGELESLGTYLELRSQAVSDPAFRETFTETTDRYVANLAAIIERGIEKGVFRDVDPAGTARFLVTITDGMIVQFTTRTDDPRPELWKSLDAYVQSALIAEDR